MTDHMTHEVGRGAAEERLSIGGLGCPGIDVETRIVDGQLEGNLGHLHLGEQLVSSCHLQTTPPTRRTLSVCIR